MAKAVIYLITAQLFVYVAQQNFPHIMWAKRVSMGFDIRRKQKREEEDEEEGSTYDHKCLANLFTVQRQTTRRLARRGISCVRLTKKARRLGLVE